MNQLHIPELMPDEFVLGYRARIGRVNGISDKAKLSNSLRNVFENQVDSKNETSLVEKLATLSKVSMQNFIKFHTLIPLQTAVTSKNNRKCDLNKRLSALGPRLMRQDIQCCEHCISEDMEFHGFSYWRRNHQLPGIDWCQKHAKPLIQLEPNLSYFIDSPSNIIKEHSYTVADTSFHEHPIITRFEEYLGLFLDMHAPLSHEVVTRYLSNRAKSLNLRVSQNGNRKLLSDLCIELIPKSWLFMHFPTFNTKVQNKFDNVIDAACMPGGMAFNSLRYILGLAVFAKPEEESQSIILELQSSQQIRSPKIIKSKNRKPIQAAYVESKGNLRKMALSLRKDYTSLSETARRAGMPSLQNFNQESLVALFDFYEGKIDLEEMFTRPDVKHEVLNKVLRVATAAHAKLLSKIVLNNRKCI